MNDNASEPSIFARAFSLLTRNWIIVLPAFLIGLVVSILTAALTGPDTTSIGDLQGSGPAVFAYYIETIVLAVATLAASTLSVAFTTGMAGAAWSKGTASVADGARAFARHPLNAIGALILLFVLGFVAAALIIPTFFISLLAYAVFFIYTMPAVLVGGRSVTEAIVESCGIAARNLKTTILVVLLILGVAVAASFVSHILASIPLLGSLVAALLTYGVVAYGTLVVVGEYLQLRQK